MRFFAPVAGTLLSLSLFAHLSSILIVGGVGLAALLGQADRRRFPWTVVVVLAGGVALAGWYFTTNLDAYLVRPRTILQQTTAIRIVVLAAGGLGLLGLLGALRRPRLRTVVHRWIPHALLATLCGFAWYAYFVREPIAPLAAHDAHALRDFAEVYLTPLGLGVALSGLVLLVETRFWRGLAFVMATVAFSVFVFYKIRIMPEHYWLARRYLPIVLPSACLLIGLAVSATAWPRLPTWLRLPARVDRRTVRAVCTVPALVVCVLIGSSFVIRMHPILGYVEYAGVIPQLEALDAELKDNDLLLVDNRNRSDLHTLAIPLHYVYGNDAVMLTEAVPPQPTFDTFLSWAWSRYERVLFAGGGGSQVISPKTAAVPLRSNSFFIPEYARTYPDVPREIKQKRFDLALYELIPRRTAAPTFDLDIGSADDLHVLRFYAKETSDGGQRTFRWTAGMSRIIVPLVRPDMRRVTVWLSSGERPPELATPMVTVSLNGEPLGVVPATLEFSPHEFPIAPGLAEGVSGTDSVVDLTIVTSAWTPADFGESADTRALGVMVDRVLIE